MEGRFIPAFLTSKTKSMKANIYLRNAALYDISIADVILGEGFTIGLDEGQDLSWFSNNDQVLSIVVDPSGLSAAIAATSIGYCSILIMNDQKKILKELNIRVVSFIQLPADHLEVTAGQAIPK